VIFDNDDESRLSRHQPPTAVNLLGHRPHEARHHETASKAQDPGQMVQKIEQRLLPKPDMLEEDRAYAKKSANTASNFLNR